LEAFCGLLEEEEEEEEEEARVHVFVLLLQMLQTTIITGLYCYCSSAAAAATFVFSSVCLRRYSGGERASERARERQKWERTTASARETRETTARCGRKVTARSYPGPRG